MILAADTNKVRTKKSGLCEVKATILCGDKLHLLGGLDKLGDLVLISLALPGSLDSLPFILLLLVATVVLISHRLTIVSLP